MVTLQLGPKKHVDRVKPILAMGHDVSALTGM